MPRRPAFALVLAAVTSGAQAVAETPPIPETLRFFNDCAGRVAAHISVHGWNDGITVTRRHLDSIDAIVASFPAADEAGLAARQSAARAAHVALLQHAMEHGDLDALNRARAHIERCREAVIAP